MLLSETSIVTTSHGFGDDKGISMTGDGDRTSSLEAGSIGTSCASLNLVSPGIITSSGDFPTGRETFDP